MKVVFSVLILASMVLTGCAQNPLMKSGRATSTESVDAIDQSLTQARQTRPPETHTTPPPSVNDALMPALDSPNRSLARGDERFDVSARDLEAARFFRGLVKGTGYNVVVHPGVSGRISLELDSVTLPEVMDTVAELYDFDIERQGKMYKVMPGGLQTRIFQIDYLDFVRKGGSETQVSSGSVSSGNSNNSGNSSSNNSQSNASTLIGTRITTETESDFWRDLREALNLIVGSGEGHKVITTPGAGVVVVRADAQSLRAVEDYLRRTQLIMKRQVILEAKILEVTLEEGYQQGVDWSAIEVKSSMPDADGNPKKFLAGQVGGQTVTSPDLGGIFSAAVRISDFSALIDLLGTQGNVQVLSSPRISTVNNQKAVIKVGSDEFFVTDIDFNENNNTTNTNNDTNTSVELTPFFSGISLDVTPQISEEGVITLHVHPSVSEVQDQQKVITIGSRDVTLPLALSTVRETDSIVSARSGQIVVIGGLIQNKSDENNAQVPFFGDIPLLGEMFKQRNFSSRKSELVILLRPMLTGEGQYQEDLADTQSRVQALKALLEQQDTPKPEAAGSVEPH
ncbi:pilus (MSHA type) biogenesis protein MshL [Marinobacteraceae bacterium S3BR75-40.1]